MKCQAIVACVVGISSACGSPQKPSGPEPAPIEPVAEAPRPQLEPPAPPPMPEVTKSLYDRLGGQPAITAVVAEFVGRTTTDPRIKERFFNTDADNLKKQLVDLVCMATGGPCKYTGRDMEAAHAGMELVDAEFDALVENLAGSLDKFQVAQKERAELLGALGPMKPQMVVAPDKLAPLDKAKLAKVSKLAGTLEDKAAADLLVSAVIAGERGQRSYAEQLFTRAELLTGAPKLASIASTFRAGAPPRVTTKLAVLPADTAAQPATIGSSEQDEPETKPAKGSLTGTLAIDGKPPAGLGVVMLRPEKGSKKRTPKQRVIEQRGKVFAPHVMAVPVGSTISFPNFDAIYHNVFSLSKTKAFDLGLYKNGETRAVKVDKPGIVRLGCNLHASMAGYLVVVDAPHYVVVGDDGAFSFKSLAPGRYKLEAWNERSGQPTTTTVVIKEGANETKVDLAASTSTNTDKFGVVRK